MHFVYEENDFTLAGLNLFEHGFEAFFELSAVLSACDERAHVERDDAFVLQALGHIASNDPLCEAFDDRGLADARLAYQHRIVLCAPRQDLNDSANLVVAPDDRVELALFGHLGQIAAVPLERFVGRLRILRRDPLMAAHLNQRFFNSIASSARSFENPSCRSAFFNYGKEQMLDAHVIVFELPGFVFRGNKSLVQPGGDVDLIDRAGRPADLGHPVDLVFDCLLEWLDVDARPCQHRRD